MTDRLDKALRSMILPELMLIFPPFPEPSPLAEKEVVPVILTVPAPAESARKVISAPLPVPAWGPTTKLVPEGSIVKLRPAERKIMPPSPPVRPPLAESAILPELDPTVMSEVGLPVTTEMLPPLAVPVPALALSVKTPLEL